VVVHAFNLGAATCGWGKGGEAARVVLERWGPLQWRFISRFGLRRMSGETL
jgi:hypothetical protein